MYSKFSPAFNNLDAASKSVVSNLPKLPQDGKKRLSDDQLVEKAMLADNFVEHGLLSVDKSVSIFGEIINLSEGRDKIFKIFSGCMKIGLFFIGRSTLLSDMRKKDLTARLKGASSATSTARSFLKLFTDWVFFRLAIRIYYKQRWGLLKVLSLGRLIGLALYFTFQLPVWLHTTKLEPSIDKAFWGKLSLKAYIVSTICQIMMDIQKLKGLLHDIMYIRMFSSHKKHNRSFIQKICGFFAGNDDNDTASTASTTNNSNVGVSNNHTSTPTKSSSNTKISSYSDLAKEGKVSIPPATHSSQVTSALLKYAAAMERVPTTLEMKRSMSHIARPSSEYKKALSISNFKFEDSHSMMESNALPGDEDSGDDSDIDTGVVAFVKEEDVIHSIMTNDSTVSPILQPTISEGKPQELNLYPPAKPLDSVMSAYSTALQQNVLPTSVADTKVSALRNALNNIIVNFIKDGGDLVGAVNGAYDLGLSDLVNGLLSLTSGGISLYRLWRRFKTVVEKTIAEKAKSKKAEQQKEEIRGMLAQ